MPVRNSDVSTSVPSPVAWRWSNAPRIPDSVVMAVMWSPTPPRKLICGASGGTARAARPEPRPEGADVVARAPRVGTFAAVAGDARVDEFWMRGAHRVGSEAEAIDGVRAQVGEEDVGARQQLVHRRLTLLGVELEHDRSLASVVEVERRARQVRARRRR